MSPLETEKPLFIANELNSGVAILFPFVVFIKIALLTKSVFFFAFFILFLYKELYHSVMHLKFSSNINHIRKIFATILKDY